MPATDMEALKSPLMGLFEKRRARKFFIYVQNYEDSDPKTHEGMDLTRVTTRELIAYVLAPGFILQPCHFVCYFVIPHCSFYGFSCYVQYLYFGLKNILEVIWIAVSQFVFNNKLGEHSFFLLSS